MNNTQAHFSDHEIIIMPRDSRRINTPFELCKERSVSDLIPTAAITDEWPVLGTTTYGEMNFSGNSDLNPFRHYIARSIKEEYGLFSRVTYTRPMTDEERRTPYRTESWFDDHYWPPILKGIKFVADYSFPRAVRLADGTVVNAPSIYSREAYINEHRGGTRFQAYYFVSDVQPTIGQYPVLGPNRVAYDFLGVSGGFESCLHDHIYLRPMPTARFLEDNSDSVQNSSGVIAGQRFPATPFKEWAPHVISHKPQIQNDLFNHVLIRVFPPAIPKVSIR